MEVIANGNTAEICEYGNNLICKLFYNRYPNLYIAHEFNNAKEIWNTLKIAHKGNYMTMITKMELIEGKLSRSAMKRDE